MDRLEITPDALPVAEAIAAATSPNAGGIAVFLGTTRGEQNHAGKKLIALNYEAYVEMAKSQLTILAARAREQWPIINLVILHRTGEVKLAEPSVLIAVSTPHRADAFDACRWIIDTLKKEVAIWKKEVWEDGEETWV